MTLRYALTILALSLSAPAVAQDNPQPKSAEDPQAVKCKAIKEVGSKIPKRTCKTVAQWNAEREAAQAAINTNARNRRCSGGSFC